MRKLIAAVVIAASMLVPQTAGATAGPGHWGKEPYLGTGIRYVWVYDHTGNTTMNSWLDVYINWINSAQDNNPNLPRLVHVVEGAQFNCNSINAQNVVNVCFGTVQAAGFTTDPVYTHIQPAWVRWYSDVPSFGSYYTWLAICHEMGHILGFQHVNDTSSCMNTTLNQYATSYVYYSTTEWTQLVALYNHAT